MNFAIFRGGFSDAVSCCCFCTCMVYVSITLLSKPSRTLHVGMIVQAKSNCSSLFFMVHGQLCEKTCIG